MRTPHLQILLCTTLLSSSWLGSAHAANLEVKRSGQRVIVRSERVEAVFEDGQITACKSLAQGVVFAAPEHNAGAMPVGLGCAVNQDAELRRTHTPWGSASISEKVLPHNWPIYLHPTAASQLDLFNDGELWRLHWQGLGTTTNFFPECAFTITIGLDTTGALCWQAHGVAPQGGIFGILTPLNNIAAAVRFVLPHFGGMEFRHTPKNRLAPFCGAPFWEAPVAAIELEGMALGLWLHNPEFAPYYVFFKNGPSGFAFGYEPNSLMPIEDKRSFTTPQLKLDIFPGDWKNAMTPFKNWYRQEFAAEIARRDSIAWADQIKLIIDHRTEFERVAATFDPSTVMFHNWNARAPDFDTELPDWTPREGFIESVEKMHTFGFKSMAYVNTYCINYQSPVFQRDHLENVFLTRKNSLWRYNNDTQNPQSGVSEMLIGTVNQAKGADQFVDIAPGKLLYGDPLSATWRHYHAEAMCVWNQTTGSDANYEDTAGCVGDHGNGTVAGLSAGQGSVEQMRLLQKTQPTVPMASEYGPEGIAFAVKWPLNYAQVWGGEKFRRQRVHTQLPVTSFLYGYTTWIPIINCGDDFTRHLITACSDATGGMGMLSSSFAELEAGGMNAHLTHRALLFTQKRLKPYFPDHVYPTNTRCYYQGIDGLYQYYDDGKLQKMLAPDGSELYARLDGSRSYKGSLKLPGWPLCHADGIFGLNPELNYALFPPRSTATEPLEIGTLPEDVMLERYYTDPNFIFLSLKGSTNESTTVDFKVRFKWEFDELYINGEPQETTTAWQGQVTLPLYLLACKKPAPPDYDQPIGSDATLVRKIGPIGIQEDQAVALKELPHKRRIGGIRGHFVNYYQDKQLDWLLRVPDPEAALKFLFQNFSDCYGNGSIVKIYLNGQLVHAYDCVKANPAYDAKLKNPKTIFNTALQERILPLGKYAGRTVLISLAVDHKSESNSDNQYIIIPLLQKSATQEWSEREVP